MEKYNRWTDVSTGINPFVPQRRRFTSGWPMTIFQTTFGSLLALVRFPLVLVSTVALVLINIAVSILTVIPFLGRLLKRLTEWMLCSLLLLLFGVLTVEESANTRRLGLTTAKAKSFEGSSRVGRGDVVVCNYTSFLEILYLAKRFSPVFVLPINEKGDGSFVHVCGLMEALYRSLAMPVSAERVKPTRKIEEVIRRACGPVVVLAEGARSNGKAVLKFIPVLQNLPVKTRVHLVAFRYEYKRFSPSHTVGGAWSHLFWTAFHLYHTMRVTVLNAKDLDLDGLRPAKPSSCKSSKKQEDSKTLSTGQVEKLRSLLAAMLRTKTVDLGPEDSLSFNNYWKHVNGGGRQPASQFTGRKAPHEHAQWAKK